MHNARFRREKAAPDLCTIMGVGRIPSFASAGSSRRLPTTSRASMGDQEGVTGVQQCGSFPVVAEDVRERLLFATLLALCSSDFFFFFPAAIR